MSIILFVTSLPITSEGIPVQGNVEKIGVPLGLFTALEIGWGGAKVIPTANKFL